MPPPTRERSEWSGPGVAGRPACASFTGLRAVKGDRRQGHDREPGRGPSPCRARMTVDGVANTVARYTEGDDSYGLERDAGVGGRCTFRQGAQTQDRASLSLTLAISQAPIFMPKDSLSSPP